MQVKKNKKNKMVLGKREIKQQAKHQNSKYGHLNTALEVAQHSTGSMGKFDQLARFEPKPKLKRNVKQDTTYLATHSNQSKKIIWKR